MTWIALSGGLPRVPVHDLRIHARDRDLVAATHGRSIWVLDLDPLFECTAEIREKALHLFPVAAIQASNMWSRKANPWYDRPDRRPKKAIRFWCREAGEARLALVDGKGRTLRKMPLEAMRGLNVYDWDLLVDLDAALAAEAEDRTAEEEAGKKGSEDRADSARRGGEDRGDASEKKGDVEDGRNRRDGEAGNDGRRIGRRGVGRRGDPRTVDEPKSQRGDPPREGDGKDEDRKPGHFEKVKDEGLRPHVKPGTYTLRLTRGEETVEVEIEVKTASSRRRGRREPEPEDGP